MTESWRLFIAVELPPEVRRILGQLQADLKRIIPERAVRWVQPEGIHLTLKFLGEVPVDQLPGLKTALAGAAAGHRCFDLGIQGLGCFPNTSRPHVLWVGITGALEKLSALQQSVEQHIVPLGFPSEERSFSPHLTLARTRQNVRRDESIAIGQVAERHDVGRLVDWQVCSISLMRSHLRPEGAVYTQVHVVELEP